MKLFAWVFSTVHLSRVSSNIGTNPDAAGACAQTGTARAAVATAAVEQNARRVDNDGVSREHHRPDGHRSSGPSSFPALRTLTVRVSQRRHRRDARGTPRWDADGQYRGCDQTARRETERQRIEPGTPASLLQKTEIANDAANPAQSRAATGTPLRMTTSRTIARDRAPSASRRPISRVRAASDSG